MKRMMSFILALFMLATSFGALAETTYQPGTYEAIAAGFGGDAFDCAGILFLIPVDRVRVAEPGQDVLL